MWTFQVKYTKGELVNCKFQV